MSKILVLAEKPSVGKDIARVLNCKNSHNGYVEGKDYIVTWALGHLVTLANPENYDKKFTSWEMGDLPIIPEKMKLNVIKQTSRQYNTVKKLMEKENVKEIIIATDAGREGELVARWIIDKARVRKPIKRLWISSVTDQAIKNGFSNLKDGREYENLYKSAVARAEVDWIVGINGTRALTCKYNAQLSCGRVQTPTLAIIAKRENEIQNFKLKTYYGISASVEGLDFIWHDQNNNKNSFSEEKVDSIIQKIKGKELHIIEVVSKVKKSKAPGLYDLTELQRDANRIFGYSAKETLNTMQKLYEHHKVLTYPRTDSKFISEDIVPTLKERIRACGVEKYSAMASLVLRGGVKTNSSFVNNNKVSDHHAIIPTEESVFLSDLSEKESRIYDLVVKRFLSVFYPEFKYEETTIKGELGGEDFQTKNKFIIDKGWKNIYSNEEKEDFVSGKIENNFKKGNRYKPSNYRKTSGQTKPPSRFTEGTLLQAMENPAKYMPSDDKKLVKIIGETGGLGTVATRADIIDKLINTFLIEKRENSLMITSKGKQLLELVPEDLKSPLLTAEWEEKLKAISTGRLNKNKFLEEMKDYTKKIVKEIQSSDAVFKHNNISRTPCPECGKYMLEVKGKKGKMLVCQDRECGCRKSVSMVTNARCPKCHKKLEMRGEGDAKTFFCKCGYREKLTAFNKRKQEKKNSGNKREVSKYLKNQNKKEEPLNNPFAEALAKLKLK